MTKFLHRAVPVASVLGLLCLLPAGAAQAEQAVSRWSQANKSAIRLVAGGTGKDGSLKAGIEVMLAKGFKTYWRSPGDSGVPPRFDWSTSENVAGITVSWPAPERFGDDQETAIGYTSDVILPLSVRPANPEKPVKLVLRLDYAVCEKICIPVVGEAELALTTAPTAETDRIAAFNARVPVPAAKSGADNLPRMLETIVLQGANGNTALQILTNWTDAAKAADVLVEGPDDWAFGKPDYRPGPDGRLAAVVPVTDRPKSVTGLVPLVVTLIGAEQATETRLDLDMSPAKP